MTLSNGYLFRDRNAILIFSSQLVSSVCDKIMSIGMVWYLTKNFTINIVPWFLVVSFLPHLIMAFFSTRLINLFGPLKTVIYTEFFRGVILLIMYLFLSTGKISGHTFLSLLFISSFLVGVGSSLFNPALLSLPPHLVEESKVVGLNALIDSSLSMSTILGAVFAIFLLNFLEIKAVILVNALSFIWAGLLQTRLKLLSTKLNLSCDENQINPSIVLKKYPDIARMLWSFLFLNLVFTPILVMMPWYVEKIYRGDSSSLAIIEGAMGLGAFLVAAILSLSHFQIKDGHRVSMISLLSLFFGMLFLIFSFSQVTWQGAIIIFLIGALTTFFNIQVLTYFQTQLEVKEIPAIMTAVNIISAASVPLSLSISGLIFPHVSIPNFAKFCGFLIIIMSATLPKFLQGQLWKSEKI